MQLVSSRIRLSNRISLAIWRVVNLVEWGKSVKVAPNEVKTCVYLTRLHSVIYGEPPKSSLKFISNKIHPTGLERECGLYLTWTEVHKGGRIQVERLSLFSKSLRFVGRVG